MKILETTTTLPPVNKGGIGRPPDPEVEEIMGMIDTIPEGAYLPVEFESVKRARRVKTMLKRRKISAFARGPVVYVSRNGTA